MEYRHASLIQSPLCWRSLPWGQLQRQPREPTGL